MTVSEILDERIHAGEPPRGVTAFVSVLAHGAFFGFLILLSRPKPLPPPSNAVPIRIVSPAALGRPGAAVSRPAAAKARPVIEKPPQDVPPPSANALPLPKSKKVPEPPKPVARTAAKPDPSADAVPIAAAPALELPSAGGGQASGEVTGTSNFGATASFDADFPFAYYVEQLQALIGANWLKPAVSDTTSCIVYFRIQRSGQITDVKVEVPSSLPYYDRAATRSLFAANPLPPLPPEYRGESLGVHLRFQ